MLNDTSPSLVSSDLLESETTLCEYSTSESIQSPSANGRPSWLQVVSHLDPKYGGLSAAVPNLGQAVSLAGHRAVTVVGFCQPGEEYVPSASGVNVEHVPLSRLSWLKQRSLSARFRQSLKQSAGVHIHGLWQQSSAVTGPIARDLGTPYVVSAHGMLESWAMANKRWKKALYMSMVEGANLRGAACLHALTEAEAQDYRRLHLKNPIAVIPNGVTVPPQRSAELFFQQFPALRNKQIALFLGRIHYKKGLDILLKAWASLRKSEDSHLVIAGPDFEGTQRRIEELVESLNLQSHVTFTGMLNGAMKWSAMEAARVFVLPSYSEGLSVSVLEAMGAAKPVIISEHCNLPEVAAHECGWVIPAQTDPLVSALSEVLSSSTAALSNLGQKAQRLVAARYSWPVIGRQMDQLYAWLEGGNLPVGLNLHMLREPIQ